MAYEYKDADGLTLVDMKAADYASSINSALHSPYASWTKPEQVIEQDCGVGMGNMKELMALYSRGVKVLKNYAVFVGGRTTIPWMIGAEPSDDRIKNALAWMLVDAGHIATSPAYRFIHFYHRKDAPVAEVAA